MPVRGLHPLLPQLALEELPHLAAELLFLRRETVKAHEPSPEVFAGWVRVSPGFFFMVSR